MLKPIETVYKNYRFRSRLEARWAVCFDAWNVRWDYEPEGFELPNGLWYLPDFRLDSGLFIEVKGVMSDTDLEKLSGFYSAGASVLVVDRIPDEPVFTPQEPCFSYRFINGCNRSAFPGIGKNGKFGVFNNSDQFDYARTVYGFYQARSARFEHGETPNRIPQLYKEFCDCTGTLYSSKAKSLFEQKYSVSEHEYVLAAQKHLYDVFTAQLPVLWTNGKVQTKNLNEVWANLDWNDLDILETRWGFYLRCNKEWSVLLPQQNLLLAAADLKKEGFSFVSQTCRAVNA